MKAIFQKLLYLFGRIPFPVTILGVCVLTYGLLFAWQGFYLDDWYIVYFNEHFGAGEFLQFFKNDRPFFAYVYMVFVPIFKDSRIGWQLFALFTRFLASLSFWWLLIKLIPNHRRLISIATLLFTVYPGFQFHWFAVMYSQLYVLMSFYFLSYVFMIKAVKEPKFKIWFTLAGILCVVIGVFPMEYFYGLEIVRPLILWAARSDFKELPRVRLGKTLLTWVPYLAVVTGFTVFRVMSNQSYSYEIKILQDFKNSPLDTIFALVGRAFWSVFDALVNVWVNLSTIFKRDLLTSASIAMLVLIAVGYIITRAVMAKYASDTDKKENILPHLMIIGLIAVVCGLIPYMAASYEVSLEFPYNRFLIALSPGACLFLTGFIEWIIRTKKQKAIVLGLLIGLSMGSQFLAARGFMIFWKQQTDFFWQLSWRAPALKENTALVTAELPFSKYFSGGSLTAPLNLIYGSDNQTKQLSQIMLLVSSPQKEAIAAFKPDQPIHYSFRSLDFSGNTSSMIVFYQPTKGCLRILSDLDSKNEFVIGNYYTFWSDAIPLSNLDQIDIESEDKVTLSRQLFGKENIDQWCYFYEKAGLANQKEKWEQTVKLYQQAHEKGYYPITNQEWIPLIQAYLNLNQTQPALEIIKGLDPVDRYQNASICKVLRTFEGPSGGQDKYILEGLNTLQCIENN